MVNKNYYTLPSFEKYKQIVHGFSTIKNGDMWPRNDKDGKNLKKFIYDLFNNNMSTYQMEQIHSSQIVKVQENTPSIIKSSDGLYTNSQKYVLCTFAADCMPILFFDPKNSYIGNIHAGRKGLQKGIVEEMITTLVSRGSDPKDIIVGIGPSIRDCCYDIGKEMTNYFNPDSFTTRKNKLFLSLQKEAISRLEKAGVKTENIEDANICTKDNSEFYSYRRNGNTKEFGEFISVIGLV